MQPKQGGFGIDPSQIVGLSVCVFIRKSFVCLSDGVHQQALATLNEVTGVVVVVVVVVVVAFL